MPSQKTDKRQTNNQNSGNEHPQTVWETVLVLLNTLRDNERTRRYVYSLKSFSSLGWLLLARAVGVLVADLLGVLEVAPALFRFLRPGPELLILSEPGLLGGESFTVGPMVPPAPTLLKCPVPWVGPWIMEDTGGAGPVDGGGLDRLLLLPRFDVVTTLLLCVWLSTADAGGVAGTGAAWPLQQSILHCQCKLHFATSHSILLRRRRSSLQEVSLLVRCESGRGFCVAV